MVVNGFLSASSLRVADLSEDRTSYLKKSNRSAACYCILQKDGRWNVPLSLRKSWSSLACPTIGPLPCHQLLRLWHGYCLWNSYLTLQAESVRLPPTKAALHQAILWALYQLMVWNNDCVPDPILPSLRGYGWTIENDEWIPIMTIFSPAPEAIIQRVTCRCAKERC